MQNKLTEADPACSDPSPGVTSRSSGWLNMLCRRFWTAAGCNPVC